MDQMDPGNFGGDGGGGWSENVKSAGPSRIHAYPDRLDNAIQLNIIATYHDMLIFGSFLLPHKRRRARHGFSVLPS